MGHISEPVGVDFVIKSEPLTKEQETAISEYIRHYKAKGRANLLRRKKRKGNLRKERFTVQP